MILRIVRMEFKEEAVPDFLAVFSQFKDQIRNQPGCSELRLMVDADHANVYYTHSSWQSVDDLNRYRESATFKAVWPLTKQHFSAPPQAYSLQLVMEVCE
jgi:quinol monooxygenase YgiN